MVTISRGGGGGGGAGLMRNIADPRNTYTSDAPDLACGKHARVMQHTANQSVSELSERPSWPDGAVATLTSPRTGHHRSLTGHRAAPAAAAAAAAAAD